MKGSVKLALLFIILIMLLAVLFGCNKEISKQESNTVKKDSISYIEKWNLDTLYIPMVADTLKIEVPINCPDQEVKVTDTKKQTTISIKGGILTVQQNTKKDSLRYVLAFKDSHEYKEATGSKIVTKNTVLYKYRLSHWFWYSLILNIIFLLWITRNIWLKLIKFPV